MEPYLTQPHVLVTWCLINDKDNFTLPSQLVYSKNKNIRDLYRGVNDFKKGYQPRSNLVKDENGDMLADSHNILNRRKNYFSQLLNVHRISDFRQIEIYTAEPLVSNPSPFEVDIATAKLKRYKSPGSDQIPAGGEILRSKIHKLINFIWNKEKLPHQWKESIIVPGHKNHENEHVRSIGQGESRHRKYKRLKLGGGQAYDRSSD
jgi:hypothetical protein